MLYILCGLPGSGKSTWAKYKIKTSLEEGQITYYISKDAIRTMLHTRYAFDPLLEPIISDTARDLLCNLLDAELLIDIIIDETHITKDKRRTILNIALDYSVPTTCVYFTEQNNNLENRLNDSRGITDRIWDSVITKMKKNFEPPTVAEGFNKLITVSPQDIAEIL